MSQSRSVSVRQAGTVWRRRRSAGCSATTWRARPGTSGERRRAGGDDRGAHVGVAELAARSAAGAFSYSLLPSRKRNLPLRACAPYVAVAGATLEQGRAGRRDAAATRCPRPSATRTTLLFPSTTQRTQPSRSMTLSLYYLSRIHFFYFLISSISVEISCA